MQQQLEAQQADLRVLRGAVAPRSPKGADLIISGPTAPATNRLPLDLSVEWRVAENERTVPSTNKKTKATASMRDPASRAEAAINALRQAKDDAARMRAADDLERVLQDIRGHLETNRRLMNKNNRQ
jgi:hypothetical protein